MMLTMRYSIGPAEAIRKRLNVSEEQFSVMLGYSPRAYPTARSRGKLTPIMARMVSIRYKVPMSDMVEEDLTCQRSGS